MGSVTRLDAGAIVLTGDAVDLLRYCIATTRAARTRAGRPPLAALDRLADAVASACPPADTGSRPSRDDEPMDHLIDTAAAADILGVTTRQARRLAPGLGGRKVAGSWLLDADAVDEHRGGIES